MARSARYKNTSCNNTNGLVAPKVLDLLDDFIIILRHIDHIPVRSHPHTQRRNFTISRLKFFAGLVMGVSGHSRLLSTLESTSRAKFDGGLALVDSAGAGCHPGEVQGGLELGALEERVGCGSDAGRFVVVGVVLARKVSPFDFLADDPAGQTEAAGIADCVAGTILFL